MVLRAQVFSEGESEPRSGVRRTLAAEQPPEALAAALFEEMYGKEK